MINYIRDQILPEFSNYVPARIRIPITNDDKVTYDFNDRTYTLNVPPNISILNIGDVYYTTRDSSSSVVDDIQDSAFFYADPRDIVMSQQYNDMMSSLSTIQSYEFIRPSGFNNFIAMVRFDKPLNTGAIVELNIVHNDLSSIDSDTYHIFKKFALKELIQLIIAGRSKYERISTNIGELNLNIQYLQSLYDELSREWEEIRNNFLKDDVYVEWV
jgi:hypothetical protein